MMDYFNPDNDLFSNPNQIASVPKSNLTTEVNCKFIICDHDYKGPVRHYQHTLCSLS